MITIRNTNERYGDPIKFSGDTLDEAVAEMQDTLRKCGPELADITVSDDDYVIECSLLEANNEINPITYLWICGVGCPSGEEFHHNVAADDPDKFYNFNELPLLDTLWELSGQIDKHGLWCWDGQGDPRDWNGNTITNIKAGWF